MATPIRFCSSCDMASFDSGGVLATSETTAITVLDTDALSTSVVSIGGNTQGTLYIDFTKGSLTNVIIKIYGSYLGNPTSSDWFQETQESDSNGTATLYAYNITLTADAKLAWHFPLGAYRSLKITYTGTGTATSSALKLYLGARSN